MKLPLLSSLFSSRTISSRLWVRGFIGVLELGLVLLLAYRVSGIVLRVLEDDSWQMPVLPDSRQATQKNTTLYTLRYDPFYRIVPSEGAQQQAIPESRLRLKLHGLRSDGTGAGSVILQVGDEPQKLVQVGDPITNSATNSVTLENVYVDRIEIKRNGVLEAVYMNPGAAKRPHPVSHSVPHTVTQGFAAGTQPNEASNLFAYIAGLDLSPVREERRIAGFMVGDGAQKEALSVFALEQGDLLLAVDDMPLTSFERLQELPDELAGKQTMSLHYERRGEKRANRLEVK